MLTWLGRQGTRAVAALIVVGIAVPPMGAVLRPYVTEAIFALLCFAFMRVDLADLKDCLKRPQVILAATLWTSLCIPLIVGAGGLGLDLQDRYPALFLALLLQAIASPIMAAPAFASLLGLNATLILAILITSTILIPVTAPLFVVIFADAQLSLVPVALGIKLFLILAGSAAVGFTVRSIFGLTAIERHKDAINGCNILILYVFVAIIMENVAGRFFRAPFLVAGLTALGFIVYIVILALTALLFWPAGRERALAIGFMTAQRNMGLMLAATGGALPETTWLYFALAQFPIYLGPHLLRPLAAKLLTQTRTRRSPPAPPR